MEADGRFLLGGDDYVEGTSQQTAIAARLFNSPGVQTLTIPSVGRATWMRSGALPEILRATFELSTNGGMTWSMLGTGTRIAGGWELTGLTLPGSGLLRARGRTTGGKGNGSSSIVEQVIDLALDTRIIAGPSGTVGSSNATFVFTANQPAQKYTYSLDGGAPVETTGTEVTLSLLEEGPHTFSVFATALAGSVDSTPATRSWRVNAISGAPGSLDPTFTSNVIGTVFTTAVLPDGTMVIGGSFTHVQGMALNNLARASVPTVACTLSIPARTRPSAPWRCSPMAGSCSAANLPPWPGSRARGSRAWIGSAGSRVSRTSMRAWRAAS